MTITLRTLLRDTTTDTITKFRIMERADRRFPVGRYHGIPLTAEDVRVLTA